MFFMVGELVAASQQKAVEEFEQKWQEDKAARDALRATQRKPNEYNVSEILSKMYGEDGKEVQNLQVPKGAAGAQEKPADEQTQRVIVSKFPPPPSGPKR